MNEYKTHTCNEISLEDVGKEVRIAGFVQTIRDFGGLVFLDIRDMYGVTQVVTSGKEEDVDFASHIPIESSVCVEGIVKKRDEETINPKLKTGLVEIKIETIAQKICAKIVFHIFGSHNVYKYAFCKITYPAKTIIHIIPLSKLQNKARAIEAHATAAIICFAFLLFVA